MCCRCRTVHSSHGLSTLRRCSRCLPSGTRMCCTGWKATSIKEVWTGKQQQQEQQEQRLSGSNRAAALLPASPMDICKSWRVKDKQFIHAAHSAGCESKGGLGRFRHAALCIALCCNCPPSSFRPSSARAPSSASVSQFAELLYHSIEPSVVTTLLRQGSLDLFLPTLAHTCSYLVIVHFEHKHKHGSRFHQDGHRHHRRRRHQGRLTTPQEKRRAASLGVLRLRG